MAEMANTNPWETKHRKAVRWWWNVEYGEGCLVRTMSLDEVSLWDCIASIYESETAHLGEPLQ